MARRKGDDTPDRKRRRMPFMAKMKREDPFCSADQREIYAMCRRIAGAAEHCSLAGWREESGYLVYHFTTWAKARAMVNRPSCGGPSVYVPVTFSSYPDQVQSALSAADAPDDGPFESNAGLFEFAESLLRLERPARPLRRSRRRERRSHVGYADANFFWMGGSVVRLRDGLRAYIKGTSVPEFSEDGETYELEWTFDVRFLADEPYHSLTPLQPSEHRPYAWEEAPTSLNELLKRLVG
jgi:hypothetical protein